MDACQLPVRTATTLWDQIVHATTPVLKLIAARPLALCRLEVLPLYRPGPALRLSESFRVRRTPRTAKSKAKAKGGLLPPSPSETSLLDTTGSDDDAFVDPEEGSAGEGEGELADPPLVDDGPLTMQGMLVGWGV
jgi:hypothetical protein